MKKFFKITAAVILLLFIFFVAVYQYRKHVANQVLIPQNTSALFKLNVDQIGKSIGLNMIFNPGYYLKSDKKNALESKLSSIKTGLKIPASIYFYSLESSGNNSFFSRLSIKNFKDFSSFLTTQLGLKIAKNANLNLATSDKYKISVLFNTEEAVIEIASQTVGFERVLQDMLNQKDFVSISDSKFKTINQKSGHLVFMDKNNNGTINFKSGEIDLTSEVLLEKIIPRANASRAVFRKQGTAQFWLNADFVNGENKTYKIGQTTLERDSLIKYSKGGVSLEWTNSTQQTDSIITYAYNDDFEKVQKVTIQKINIPNLRLDVNADAIDLQKYLARQQIINLDSGLLNKKVFPLYKVYVSATNQNLTLGTQKATGLIQKKVTTADFFFLAVDFEKASKQIDIPIFSNYFKTFNQLQLKGTVISGQKVKVDGTLSLKNKDVNSLYQLLNTF